MKEKMRKLSTVIKKLVGYGIVATLFSGGFIFFAYVIALILGGDVAALICDVVSNRIVPILIYVSNICVVLGLIAMYMAGEKALTPESGSEEFKK